MKAKLIYEKFTEEGTDVIQDMGIGDPEMIKAYKSLEIVNNMAHGEISGSFNLKDAFEEVSNLYQFIYLAIKFHVAEKFNLDLHLGERTMEYPAAIEFGVAKVGSVHLKFKTNNDTNEVYVSVSEVKRFKRMHLMTSTRCKTIDQLDRQIQRIIDKLDLKITP